MTLKIRTPDGRLILSTQAGFGAFRAAVRRPVNDAVLDEAAVLLRRALAHLDTTGSLIAAAHVDQALSLLRVDRLAGEGR